MIKDDYDLLTIKLDYNEKLRKIKQAIAADDEEMLEELLLEPLYDHDSEIPRIKHTYKVTLKRVMTRAVEVEAEDEDDAVALAESTYDRLANMNDWECDEELDPDVEEID